jgi:hypothetical protein
MPVPGKHDDEPRSEIQADLFEKWLDARDQAMSWGKVAADYRQQLEDQLGTSTGGMIHGKLVVTYRPKGRYAVAALVRDNPALTQHYMKTREVSELDIDTFVSVHRDIADKYRIREFRVAGGVEEDGTEG